MFSKVLSSCWVQHPQETFGLHNVVIALFEEERLFEEEEEEDDDDEDDLSPRVVHLCALSLDATCTVVQERKTPQKREVFFMIRRNSPH